MLLPSYFICMSNSEVQGHCLISPDQSGLCLLTFYKHVNIKKGLCLPINLTQMPLLLILWTSLWDTRWPVLLYLIHTIFSCPLSQSSLSTLVASFDILSRSLRVSFPDSTVRILIWARSNGIVDFNKGMTSRACIKGHARSKIVATVQSKKLGK
jgi:hypothetical protein